MNRRRFLAFAGLAGAGLAGATSCAALRTGRGKELWRERDIPHFDGRRFFNPEGPTGNTLLKFLKWRRTRDPAPWPDRVENTARPVLPGTVPDGEAHVTFVNHCTFLIQLPGINILTDPVYSERVSPVTFAGPKRVRDPGLPWDALPRIDAVVISHSHYDHLDIATLEELYARFRPKFYTGLGNRALLEGRGIRDVTELDWWQAADTTSLEAEITFTPVQHWTSRTLLDRNTTLWGGFHIRHGAMDIFFCGDAGYGDEFTAIRARFGPPALALLPIGAFKPRWFMEPSHMAPDEAVKAHLDLGAQRSFGMHFDTFPLADEGYGTAETELAEARDKAGLPDSAFPAPATGSTAVITV
ncbi:MAG: MBL fold metallo-hydrolase [Opitutales bacterium]|nr:MBL fold metallo-hydrolase [Opitutales bacterium]